MQMTQALDYTQRLNLRALGRIADMGAICAIARKTLCRCLNARLKGSSNNSSCLPSPDLGVCGVSIRKEMEGYIRTPPPPSACR